MPPKNIICGQKISQELQREAKEQRKYPTLPEKLLWKSLRRNKLCGFHFRRQQVIGRYIVDFYCHQVGLVVELDGPIHLRQVDVDRERDARLEAQGFAVLRFNNHEITEDIETVLDEILSVLIELNKKA